MFFFPTDIFTPYINGREKAIQANWNDLNQFNNVVGGQLNNDAKQLSNWFTQDTYNDRLGISNANARQAQNTATLSDYNTQIATAEQPGKLSDANYFSQYQTALNRQLNKQIPGMTQNQTDYLKGVSDEYGSRGQQLSNDAGQLYGLQHTSAIQNMGNDILRGQYENKLIPQQMDVQQQMLNALTEQRQQPQQPPVISANNNMQPVDLFPSGPQQSQDQPNIITDEQGGRWIYVTNADGSVSRIPLDDKSSPSVPVSDYGNQEALLNLFN